MARCGWAPATARSCSASIPGPPRRARWPTSPATRSARSRPPFRGGGVAAANDPAEQPPATAKTPAQVESAEKPNAAKGQAAKPPEVGSKPGADKDPVPVTDLGRKGAKKGKGALFRVSKDGRLEQLHALTQTYFTALAV